MNTRDAQIYSYEPFHIGMKINPSLASDPISFRKKLLKAFNSRVSEKDPNRLMGIEVIKQIKSERVELNYDAFALNTVGSNPKSTLRMYKHVLSSIESLNYEIEGFASFQEILSNINIKVSKRPLDILKRLSKFDLTPFETIAPIQTMGMRFGLQENKVDEIFNLLLEINPVSPQTMLVMRLLYRTKNNDKIIELCNKLETLIYRFVNIIVKAK